MSITGITRKYNPFSFVCSVDYAESPLASPAAEQVILKNNIRGGVKKSGTFRWCPPQSGLSPPPPQLWSKYYFFVGK